MGCSAQVNPVHKNIGKQTVAGEQADTMKENKPTAVLREFPSSKLKQVKDNDYIYHKCLCDFTADVFQNITPSSLPQTIRKKNRDNEMTKLKEKSISIFCFIKGLLVRIGNHQRCSIKRKINTDKRLETNKFG